jgi:hypothetical protein
MMLVPPPRWPKLVPPKPRVSGVVRFGTDCHWMPNSAAFSAESSTISASTYTCARRTSSLSITAFRLAKMACGAEMMTALDAASACTMPPAPPGSVGVDCGAACEPGACGVVPGGGEVSPPRIARSVCATRTASAFLRYTTWMLPAAPVGTSSCCTIACTRAMRAGLSERTIKLFVRGSGATMVRMRGSIGTAACPGAAWPSARIRFTVSASSAAPAKRSGITTGSPPPGRSIASMMRAMRLRLSA